MDKQIYILSGPVHSGKTTHLLRWFSGRKDIGGILSPVINGLRVFQDIRAGTTKKMEAEGDEEVYLVGKYRFSKSSFEWANDIITKAAQENCSWLVIDEIGPLEIKEEGFYNTLQQVIQGKGQSFQLVLVVRDSILDSVISKFKLDAEGYSVVDASSPIFG